MTSVPPESGRLPGHETHQARQVAESFGGVTMRYTTVVVSAANG